MNGAEHPKTLKEPAIDLRETLTVQLRPLYSIFEVYKDVLPLCDHFLNFLND